MTASTDRAGLVRVMARSVLRISDREWPIDTFPGALLDAEKILAALEAAGCRVVPVEATAAQYDAAAKELVPAMDAQACYRAMLAASPFAPQQGDKP